MNAWTWWVYDTVKKYYCSSHLQFYMCILNLFTLSKHAEIYRLAEFPPLNSRNLLDRQKILTLLTVGDQTHVHCSINVDSATCKVRNKMQNNSYLTHSKHYSLVWNFSFALYTTFEFRSCFDTDIKFRVFILHFMRCQFCSFALCILYVPRQWLRNWVKLPLVSALDHWLRIIRKTCTTSRPQNQSSRVWGWSRVESLIPVQVELIDWVDRASWKLSQSIVHFRRQLSWVK